MTAKFLLASLLILAFAGSLRAQPRTGYSAIAADVSSHRLRCPTLSQLPFCYRPIQNLVRHGESLSKFCCGIVNEISHPCDSLFRFHRWFIVSRQNCAATTPSSALPAHGGSSHVAPQPVAAPVSAPTPSLPVGLGFLAPAPAVMEEEPSPAPAPSRAHVPKRMLVTISELGAHCHDAINRFNACRNNYAGSHNFDDAITTPCCDAVKDIISVCSPEDWPSVPYFLSSSDRCINPNQQEAERYGS